MPRTPIVHALCGAWIFHLDGLGMVTENSHADAGKAATGFKQGGLGTASALGAVFQKDRKHWAAADKRAS